MAIEKVKRTWFLVERGRLDDLVRGLAGARSLHVVDLRLEAPGPGEGAEPVARPLTDAAPDDPAAARAARLEQVLAIIDGFVPPRRAFHENFVSLPAEMDREQFERGVAEVDPDALHRELTALQHEHVHAEKQAAECRDRIGELEPWAAGPMPRGGLARCHTDVGTVPGRALDALRAAAAESDDLAVQTVAASGSRSLVSVAWLKEADAAAREQLEAAGFESLDLDPGAGTISDRIAALRAELDAAEKQVAGLESRAAEHAGRRDAVLAAFAHWRAKSEEQAASAKALASKRMAVLSGYVRVREMARLEALLARDFPAVSLVARDPGPDERVPVSLGGSRLFAPAQFLTSMFGLPNYFEFDPSPFIFLAFVLFFGFCFGDVIYGTMLLGLGWWLGHKSRAHRSLARFFSLLTWCGLASIIVGLLTGSWAADLFIKGYLGAGPQSLAQSLAVIDPLERTVDVLLIVLGIGVANQFFGMAMLMYREWRKGHYFAALCDGGLWLIFLPGLVLLLAAVAAGLSPAVKTVALCLVGLGGIGLVLTQGRREKTLLGKAVTGVVSLYGILGTYGTTSFIGDTLSYSRLLALGLTTVIVGMSFNIIAGLFGGMPVPGLAQALFIVVVVFGHLFNFLISILGGFIHSARLIFVEFFTKFYEGGARPFAPLGVPTVVRVTDQSLSAT